MNDFATGEPQIQIAIGGLFRCCILTLHEMHESGELEKLTHARCKYCRDGRMCLDGHIWKWDWRATDQGTDAP